MRHESEQLPLPMAVPGRTQVIECDSNDLERVLADARAQGKWAFVLEVIGRATYRVRVAPMPKGAQPQEEITS